MTEWTGPTCVMCNGTGEDFGYIEIEETRTKGSVQIIRTAPTGRPCRACNGHGREASPTDGAAP